MFPPEVVRIAPFRPLPVDDNEKERYVGVSDS
jgi:hypothetical protein